jgi:outer membrane autotransporter protein
VDKAQAFTDQQSAYLATKRSGIQAWSALMQSPGPRPGSLALARNDPATLAAAIAQMEGNQATTTTAIPSEDRWGSYARIQGVFADQDSTAKRTGFDAESFGAQVGFDYRFTRDFAAGLAFGYTYTNADWDGDRGDIDDNSLRVGPYASFMRGDWYVDGSLTFAYHFYDAERKIPSLERTADSDYDGLEFSGFLGTGYYFEIKKNLHLTPTFSVHYSYFDFDSFTETGGGGANLSVDDRDSDSLRTRLGATLSYKGDWAWKLLPYVFLGWEHEYLDDDDVEALFTSGGNPFQIDTGTRESDSVFFGTGVNALIKHNMSTFFRIERAIGDDSDVTGFAAGVSLVF